MKVRFATLGIGIAVLIAALALGSWALAQSGEGQPATGLSGSDERPTGPPEVVIPERYQPGEASLAPDDGSDAELYFVPQDNNTNTTVLFLYNTSSADATVSIQSFRLAGSPAIDTSFTVPAGALVRVAADRLAETAPISWEDTIYLNFADASAYARLTLPRGVKADGYVAWNGGSLYDPNAAVPVLPLRFSTDPATVFLPAVTNDHP